MALLMVATALQFSLLALRADAEGFGSWAIPAMSSCYFAGFLLGGQLGPKWIDTVGHTRTCSALASMASVVILVQAMSVEPATWAIARVISGLCIAGMVTAVEAWLNAVTEATNRGATISVYMVVMYLGFGGGQMLAGVGGPRGFGLFAIASMLLSLCLVPALRVPVRARRSVCVKGLG